MKNPICQTSINEQKFTSNPSRTEENGNQHFWNETYKFSKVDINDFILFRLFTLQNQEIGTVSLPMKMIETKLREQEQQTNLYQNSELWLDNKNGYIAFQIIVLEQGTHISDDQAQMINYDNAQTFNSYSNNGQNMASQSYQQKECAKDQKEGIKERAELPINGPNQFVQNVPVNNNPQQQQYQNYQYPQLQQMPVMNNQMMMQPNFQPMQQFQFQQVPYQQNQQLQQQQFLQYPIYNNPQIMQFQQPLIQQQKNAQPIVNIQIRNEKKEGKEYKNEFGLGVDKAIKKKFKEVKEKVDNWEVSKVMNKQFKESKKEVEHAFKGVNKEIKKLFNW